MYFSALFWLARLSPIWDYDAYGSVISHIELDDQRFKIRYIEYLTNIGMSETLSDFIYRFIFPVFIVPIRWTYALGISPVYGLARFVSIDWPELRFIFLFAHVAISTFGLIILYKSIKRHYKDHVLFLFVTFLFFSPAYIYWTLSLSPYSFHLFCVALLIRYQSDQIAESGLFSSRALARSVVQFFNYQYVPVVFLLGFFDFLKTPYRFFSERKFKEWILPGLTAMFSVLFIYLRFKITGKHSSPNLSVLSFNDPDKYSIWANSSNLIDGVYFFLSRYSDILTYFFDSNDYYLVLSSHYGENGLIFLVVLLIFLLCSIFYKSGNEILKVCAVVFISSSILYILDIYPFMPSRHSLILFVPFAIVASIYLGGVIGNRYFWPFVSVILLFFSTLYIFNVYTVSASPLDIGRLHRELLDNEVDRIVLVPCNQEPLFYSKVIKSYQPLYACGSEVIDKINQEDTKIAVYSKSDISVNDARENIAPFLYESWDIEGFKYVKKIYLASRNDLNFDREVHTLTIFDCCSLK